MKIYEMVKDGMPLKDILIIDAHCHMGFTKFFSVPGESPEIIIDTMDYIGMDLACVSHTAALAPDYKWGNDRIIEAVQKYPERFIGYCTINPHYPEEIPGELKRCSGIDGISGIKLHPQYHGQTMEHKNYRVVYEFAAKNKCHILVHVYSREEIGNMGKYASEYPDISFIMGHTGGEVEYMEYAIDIINKHDNIYADLTGSEAKEGIIEWLVREIGSKRLLFGTDMPYYCPRATVARIAAADIHEEEKRDIFGLNMKKILKL